MSIEQIEAITFFGSSLIDFSSMGSLLFKLALNLISLTIIIKYIFFPIYRDRSYVFAYSLINISVFLLTILLSGVKLKMGFAFGLFAVFSIIRYRTEQVPIKQMTYLFLVIVIGVVNALANKKVPHIELLFTNFFIVATVYYLDRVWYKKNGGVKTVRYEKIELIKPENKKELIADLSNRTGLNIERADIVKVNFLNDTAEIKIHFIE